MGSGIFRSPSFFKVLAPASALLILSAPAALASDFHAAVESDSAPVTLPAAPAAADADFLEQTDSRAAFGKKAGYILRMSPDANDTGVIGDLVTKLLGQDRSLLEASAKSTDLLEGETELTLAGMKIGSSHGEFKNGAYTFSAGLPTTVSRLKVIAVPVGPVSVQVDAGLAYEAEVAAALTPLISLPIQFTSLEAKLNANANVAGFLEGYAQFLFVRGGLGADLDIVRGKAGIDATLGIGPGTRRVLFTGFLESLAGRFYAFADIFNIFGFHWKRIFEPTLADWNGFCVDLNRAAPDPDSLCTH